MFVDGFIVILMGLYFICSIAFTWWAMRYIEMLEDDNKELVDEITTVRRQLAQTEC